MVESPTAPTDLHRGEQCSLGKPAMLREGTSSKMILEKHRVFLGVASSARNAGVIPLRDRTLQELQMFHVECWNVPPASRILKRVTGLTLVRFPITRPSEAQRSSADLVEMFRRWSLQRVSVLWAHGQQL